MTHVASDTQAAGATQLTRPIQPTRQVRLSRLFFRDGFPEVGLLVNGDEPICSGVLIHQEWILTAAHCVAEMDSSGSPRALFGARQLGFYVPKPGSPQAYVVDGQGRRIVQGDALRHLAVEESLVHDFWTGEENRDVALLRVSDALAIGQNDLPEIINKQLTGRTEITLAGYGNTSSEGGPSGGMLEVGWQKAHFEAEELTTFR